MGNIKKVITIGVLIGNANSPHTMSLMDGIYHSAEELGVSVVFFLGVHNHYYYRSYFGESEDSGSDYQSNIVFDYTAFEKLDALIISYGTLGIFLKGSSKTEFLSRFSHIPYVIMEDLADRPDCSSIMSDNYNGMCQVMEHLVTVHGYRKFTHLAGPRNNQDAIERRQAVFDVLEKYGIPFDESHVEYGDYSSCVEPEANRLLDRFPDMDVMVCANDMMAVTVSRECEKRGLRVGEDIAITGYDDWETGRTMIPPLTTLLQDSVEMGRMALKEAIALCSGKAGEAIVIPAVPRFRGSCGCSWREKISIHSILTEKERYETFMQETWFMPLITRDMMAQINNSADFFRGSMNKLYRLGAQASYLYVFEKPIPHDRGEKWVMPPVMHLAALHEGEKIGAFQPGEQPVLSAACGFSGHYSLKERFSLNVFCLYSGRYQYGILVTEIRPSDLSLFYLISMQIGNALSYYDLFRKEQDTQKRLEKLLIDLNEKNETLNFISGTDALTGCLNRRGFLDYARSFNEANAGSEAVAFFADLDHLKEINDTLGHKEGDFALQQSVQFLQSALPMGSSVGRLGGDEFVAVCLCSGELMEEKVLEAIRMAEEEFNGTSAKEYYVEISVGYQHFRCGDDARLTEILDQADKVLYSQKKQRRKTVMKTAP